MMDSDIILTSEIGQGSTFSFTILLKAVSEEEGKVENGRTENGS